MGMVLQMFASLRLHLYIKLGSANNTGPMIGSMLHASFFLIFVILDFVGFFYILGPSILYHLYPLFSLFCILAPFFSILYFSTQIFSILLCFNPYHLYSLFLPFSLFCILHPKFIQTLI